MWLERIKLKNFRCFDDFTIDFQQDLTVLTAPNGGGKTTTLDAIAIALTPFVGRTGGGKGKSIRKEDSRDIRMNVDTGTAQIPAPLQPVSLSAVAWVNEEKIMWGRGKTPRKYGPYKYKDIGHYASDLMTAIADPKVASVTTLPIVASYGIGRLMGNPPSPNDRNKSALVPRNQGYQGCLGATSALSTFTIWFQSTYEDMLLERIRQQTSERVDPNSSILEHAVRNVRSAVQPILKVYGECWLDFEISTHEVIIVDPPRRTSLPLSQQSAGVQLIVAMVGDIAARTSILNPQFGAEAAKKTPGIVLIDEVDMHLHPSWQQVILQSLREAFPLVQFIVTTHSPQVLSTVRRENIRVIGPDASNRLVATPPLARSYGIPSGDVLESVMHVDPQPPVVEKAKLRRLTELVDQGAFDSAEADSLWNEVAEALGAEHSQLQRLRRSMERQKALRK